MRQLNDLDSIADIGQRFSSLLASVWFRRRSGMMTHDEVREAAHVAYSKAEEQLQRFFYQQLRNLYACMDDVLHQSEELKGAHEPDAK